MCRELVLCVVVLLICGSLGDDCNVYQTGTSYAESFLPDSYGLNWFIVEIPSACTTDDLRWAIQQGGAYDPNIVLLVQQCQDYGNAKITCDPPQKFTYFLQGTSQKIANNTGYPRPILNISLGSSTPVGVGSFATVNLPQAFQQFLGENTSKPAAFPVASPTDTPYKQIVVNAFGVNTYLAPLALPLEQGSSLSDYSLWWTSFNGHMEPSQFRLCTYNLFDQNCTDWQEADAAYGVLTPTNVPTVNNFMGLLWQFQPTNPSPSPYGLVLLGALNTP